MRLLHDLFSSISIPILAPSVPMLIISIPTYLHPYLTPSPSQPHLFPSPSVPNPRAYPAAEFFRTKSPASRNRSARFHRCEILAVELLIRPRIRAGAVERIIVGGGARRVLQQARGPYNGP
jgi:hypothetical protein